MVDTRDLWRKFILMNKKCKYLNTGYLKNACDGVPVYHICPQYLPKLFPIHSYIVCYKFTSQSVNKYLPTLPGPKQNVTFLRQRQNWQGCMLIFTLKLKYLNR